MGSRERKRAERQKRKRRSAQRGDATAAPANGVEGEPDSFQERISRRSEVRNAEVRAGLEPLAEGERPTAVTVGAIVSVILALLFTASTVIAATGSIEVQGEEPSPVGIGMFAGALWLMAWGMWKARYWAVLGFQVLLLIVLVLTTLGLVSVSTVPQLLATVLLMAGSGALFYFMVRAMARIQMPKAPGGR